MQLHEGTIMVEGAKAAVFIELELMTSVVSGSCKPFPNPWICVSLNWQILDLWIWCPVEGGSCIRGFTYPWIGTPMQNPGIFRFKTLTEHCWIV